MRNVVVTSTIYGSTRQGGSRNVPDAGNKREPTITPVSYNYVKNADIPVFVLIDRSEVTVTRTVAVSVSTTAKI